MSRVLPAMWLILLVSGCGGGGGGGGGATAPGDQSFTVSTPTVSVPALTVINYCYYFRTPNLDPISIWKFQSRSTGVVKRFSVYYTEVERAPPGTMSAANCTVWSGGLNSPRWLYSAGSAASEFTFPSDDGSGKPIGTAMAPGRYAFIFITFYNDSANPVDSGVEFSAIAYPQDVQVTNAGSFLTYKASISIPANSSSTETMNCTLPPGQIQFFAMTTESRTRTYEASIQDGATTVFGTTNWENPGMQQWSSPSFYSFASNQLTTQCLYNNSSNITVVDGDSYLNNEVCMAKTYFFPASQSYGCYDGTGPF